MHNREHDGVFRVQEFRALGCARRFRAEFHPNPAIAASEDLVFLKRETGARNDADSPTDWRDFLFPILLVVLTLSMRILCRGHVYFADGPSHIDSIIQKSYVIQPPGYWLFNRIAGLFPDPVVAIVAMNILFSTAGTVAFYFTARFFAEGLGRSERFQ